MMVKGKMIKISQHLCNIFFVEFKVVAHVYVNWGQKLLKLLGNSPFEDNSRYQVRRNKTWWDNSLRLKLTLSFNLHLTHAKNSKKKEKYIMFIYCF